jgi:mono/diheme cytochrome c family protein
MSSFTRAILLQLPLLAAGIAAAHSEEPASGAPAGEFFEKEIRPLLVEKCHKCHDDAKAKGGLRLTSRANILQGGDNGPAIVAGKPDASLLLAAVRQSGELKMPPKEKLKETEIAKLADWIKSGAAWPDAATDATSATVRSGEVYQFTEAQRHFWSFQPVKHYDPPVVRNAYGPTSAIDRFILAALDERGLRPALPADKRTLLRRATFDLLGLPPTPQEINDFLADNSTDAFARVVDRLLASPHYGERWGRHWLDVVRYTDSFDARILQGAGNIMDIPASWRYRDWVVNAFNRDLPYDQFIIHQIAGDLLSPQANRHDQHRFHSVPSVLSNSPTAENFNPDGIIATGMLAIGNWGGGDADKEKLLTDIADDQIDVVGRAFLGLTLACARCHDHKFDPIPTEDYYGLAGIFASTHILQDPGPKTDGPPMLRIPLISPAEKEIRAKYEARITELEKSIKDRTEAQKTALAKSLLPQVSKYLLATWDFQHRSPDQRKQSLAQFAADRQLHAFALRQWIAELGFGDYRLMTKSVRDVHGRAGVHAWKGEPDCPNLTVNTTDREQAILTFKLPPRSVAVHPGPKGGVGVAWRSPISGTVSITGRVADADPAGGDGIGWTLTLRSAGRTALASGDIANGGAQAFAQGKQLAPLGNVAVHAGDYLELAVLPKENYICDTTVVEWEIAEIDGQKRCWNLTADLLGDPLGGNPHSDCQANPEIWFFHDMTDVPALSSIELGEHGSAWHAAKNRADAEKAAKAIERAVLESEPDSKLYQELISLRSPFRVQSPGDEESFPAEARAALSPLKDELAAFKNKPLPPIPFAHGCVEGGCPKSPQEGIHDVKVHIRGRYDRLGTQVPRHFPRILAGDNQPPIGEGSGRLQLARWIARPDHPLTARVMVNRIWQHHFGEGLVRTPGNFGKLGQPPTHPQLLDYLAERFVQSGWSVKTMHRLIMLSATYQQCSIPDEATRQADPDDRLCGWVKRRRLEAEAIRDSLLAVTGRLDRTLGGLPVRDLNSPRRTLYLMTVRSDRTTFRELFDAADPTAIIDQRIDSTVAPQALFMLNHPFALEQAKLLAQRIRQEGSADDKARIERLYVLLYGRPPNERELAIGLRLVTGASSDAWGAYCHVLLCANEFVYVD